MRRWVYTPILILLFIISLPPTPYSTAGLDRSIRYMDVVSYPIDPVERLSPSLQDARFTLSWISETLQQFLSNIPLKYYVIFVGVDPSWVDESLIRSRVHSEYPLVDISSLYIQRTELKAWMSFDIQLEILYAPDSLRNSLINFINSNNVVLDAPTELQLGAGVAQAAYIPHDTFQNWLVSQVRQLFPETRGQLTLVVINTYPDIRFYYYYNNTGPDVDLGMRSIKQLDAVLAVGGGGLDRLLFFDLSAGPTPYNNVSQIIKPIWNFDLPGDRQRFSAQIAYLIDSVIAFKFPSNLVYPPIQFTEVSFEAYWILNNTNIDPRDYMTPEMFVSTVSELFGGLVTVKYVDRGVYSISDFPSLEQAIRSESGGGRMAKPDVVHQWFLENRESFIDPDPELEIPMIALFDMSIDYVGGIALNDEQGRPLFIMSHLPSFTLTGGYRLVGEPIQTYVNPGDIIEARAIMFPSMADGEILIEGSVDGVIEIYILDGIGYYNLTRGLPVQPRFQEQFNTGNIQVRFSPRTVGGTFFILIYNPSWSLAAVNLNVYTYFPGWIGMTTLLVHEAGHILALSHPHNGFNYTALQQGGSLNDVLPIFWLWSMADGYMTYFHVKGANDQLQIDQAMIAYTALYYDSAYGVVRQAIEPFERFGFTILPEEVENTVGVLNRSLGDIPSLLGDPNTYYTAFEKALNAYRNIGNFSFNIEEYLLTLEYRVLDRDGNPLPNVDVEVTYPNGTVRTLTTDESGLVTVSRAPWGEYSVRIIWSGVEVGRATFTETSSGSREISTDVFRLNVVFRDGDGDPLVNDPEEVRIVHDVLGELTYRDGGIQTVPGRITIERVVYLGVDVTPDTRIFDVDGPTTIEVNLRIFDLTISFTDSNGNSIVKNLRLEFNIAGQLRSIIASGESYQMPAGTFQLVGVYMEGVNVLESQMDISIDGDLSINIVLRVYRLVIRAIDTLERDVTNALEDVSIILRHPNGSEITFSGGLTIEQAVAGEWKVVAILIGDYREEAGLDIQLNSNQVVDVTLPIGRLTINIYDSTGSTEVSDAEITVVGPDGKAISLSSGETIEYAIKGVYTISSVSWRGVDVTPSNNILNFEGGDASLQVQADIYRVRIVFTDVKARELNISKVSYNILHGNQRFTLERGEGLLPRGFIRITGVTYQGVTFNQEFGVEVRPGVLSITLPIFTLSIEPLGLGEPLPSFGYEVRHPNGSIIRGEASGRVDLDFLPQGGYSVRILYLGVEVYSEDLTLSGDRLIQPETNVRLLSGRVVDILGFPLSGSEVRIVDPNTGSLLTIAKTSGDGRYRMLIPDIDVVVEAGFVVGSSATVPKGVQRGDLSVPLTPTSLAIYVVVLGGVVGGYLYMRRRGGVSAGGPRPRVGVPRSSPSLKGGDTYITCPSCGYENKPTSKFCIRCGTRLRE